MTSEGFREHRHISIWQTDIQLLKWTEIEVRKMKIVGRGNDVPSEGSNCGDGVGCAVETGGKDDHIELGGIAGDALQSVGQVIYREGRLRVGCVVAGAAEFRDFVAEIEEESRQIR